jgi:ubiquinol-cytochrome c reductase iron-sulfur subunit
MTDNQDNNVPGEGATRRDFIVMSAAGVAAVGAVAAAVPFASSLAPSAEVKALSTTEVDLTKIPEGNTATILHRGQPVFVRHRTKAEIEAAENVDISILRDPETDEQRVKKGKEQWLVTSAVCTHLGCVPLADQGDYKGWLCPCHGSDYDTSGRIRKGPAPKNLPVQDYEDLPGNKIKLI